MRFAPLKKSHTPGAIQAQELNISQNADFCAKKGVLIWAKW